MDVLYIIGLAISIVGWLWTLVAIFRNSVGWGIASIFLPFVSLLAVAIHWDSCKKPFFTHIVGILVICSLFVFDPAS